jgi:hypothetical protein
MDSGGLNAAQMLIAWSIASEPRGLTFQGNEECFSRHTWIAEGGSIPSMSRADKGVLVKL